MVLKTGAGMTFPATVQPIPTCSIEKERITFRNRHTNAEDTDQMANPIRDHVTEKLHGRHPASEIPITGFKVGEYAVFRTLTG